MEQDQVNMEDEGSLHILTPSVFAVFEVKCEALHCQNEFWIFFFKFDGVFEYQDL